MTFSLRFFFYIIIVLTILADFFVVLAFVKQENPWFGLVVFFLMVLISNFLTAWYFFEAMASLLDKKLFKSDGPYFAKSPMVFSGNIQDISDAKPVEFGKTESKGPQ